MQYVFVIGCVSSNIVEVGADTVMVAQTEQAHQKLDTQQSPAQEGADRIDGFHVRIHLLLILG